MGTKLERPGLAGQDKPFQGGMKLEGARPLQTRLLCRSGGVHSLTAGLITVLLRQEPQLLNPPWIVPHVLCLGVEKREM